MRTIISLAATLLAAPSLADSVRHLSVPEHLRGTWALSAEACRDDKTLVVVGSQGYKTGKESCAVQWVTETAGRLGPIYSAHMRCTSSDPSQQVTEINRIIVPKPDGQLLAGSNFDDLENYERCPAN
jgi:hypothetical protein